MRKIIFVLFMSLICVACVFSSSSQAAMVETPAWEWEAKCMTMLWKMELVPTGVQGFRVKEYPERDLTYRFEHTLEINDFITIMYYDDGASAFNSAVLTFNLDKVGDATGPVWLAITAAIMAGDPKANHDLIIELMNVICPAFDDVLAGKERLNGAQAGTLNGIGYMMELNDNERFARFFTNAVLTPKDQPDEN